MLNYACVPINFYSNPLLDSSALQHHLLESRTKQLHQAFEVVKAKKERVKSSVKEICDVLHKMAEYLQTNRETSIDVTV
jgi:hypothetical protein